MVTITISPFGLKRVLQQMDDSGITELFLYEDESGRIMCQKPTPSIPVETEEHAVYPSNGVYLRQQSALKMYHSALSARKDTVEITQMETSLQYRCL